MNSLEKIIVLLFIAIIGGLVAFRLSKQESVNKTTTQLTTPAFPSPYNEMTIPYLREREYKSSLGKREVYSENANYTSYLTSYTSDGLKINGLLTIPKGQPPKSGWSGIVFVHGYISPSQYATTSRYVDYVDYLARSGYVVFKIDLRGHGNSEGKATGAYYSGDYIIDTLNARAALQSSDFVNPKKIGLWGHSMAGNIVLRSLAARPDIPVAVIWSGAVYSYTDFNKYKLNDLSYRPPDMSQVNAGIRQEVFKKYGQVSASSPFWKEVAPTNYLNDLKGAIQLNHTVDDATVNIGYSRDLNALLNKTKIPHELNEYPTGGHNISGAYFNQAMQNTVRFFDKYLK